MEISDIELIIFSISVALSAVVLIVGLVRGLYSAKVLGGGVMTMVMTWLIFILILNLSYNLIYFLGLPGQVEELKFVATIILLLVPICALRVIWGFAEYVKELQKLSQ
jgi:hypothetical protein